MSTAPVALQREVSPSRTVPGGRGRESAIASAVAWLPQRELDPREWASAGRRLGAIGRCSQWWIGDWVRYGAARWGERYVEASRITGYDVSSLRNMAWVASRFDDLSLRSDKLTWSHHVLLAPLDPEEAQGWIERAASERWSVADLRIELRAAQRERGELPAAPAVEVTADGGELVGMVCPQCGHRLSAPVT
jgi:hypothetical protein